MLKIVKTENGLVRGLAGNNARISVFKGIPYAAPPVGRNRWCAPRPAQNWDGIKDAFSFAPISIQDTPGLGDDIYCREFHVDSQIEMSEDCLYVNVWTPALSESDNLPVLVWFFGGGFQWGYPSEMEFNGENIAKRGVVVVSVNYRLGPLGFLAHEELTKEAPEACTNFGLLDQLAGLMWTERNITAFGGNPKNITIAGQSAGGASVLSHLTSEKAIGHFQKAIIYSGIIRNPYTTDDFITPQPLKKAQALGKAFFDYLNVTSLEEARQLDALVIRDKYAEFAASHPRFSPCIDRHFITADPFRLFLAGKHAHVPLLSGNTYDEFPSFIEAPSQEAFIQKARTIFGSKTDAFLAFAQAHTKVNNSFYAPCRGIELAVKCAFAHNNADSYYYSFEADIPGSDNPGTFHSVDLWFFFETLAASFRPYTGRHFDLARQMCNYVTNFIQSGNPNGPDNDGTPMPEWLPYRTDAQNEMHFTKDGCRPDVQHLEFYDFLIDCMREQNQTIRKQDFNPYLSS